MKKNSSGKIIITLILIFLVLPNILLVTKGCIIEGTLANLVLKTTGGNIKPDYGLYIAKYLKDIGVEVEIQIEEYSIFVAQINYTHNYDIFISDFNVNTPEFNMFDTKSPVFDEVTDPFGIHISNWSRRSLYFDYLIPIPHMNTYNELMDDITNSTDQLEIQKLTYDLQELVMDKILPMLPLFWKNNSASFSYLGFNSRRPFLGLSEHFEYLDSPGKEVYTKATAARKAICYTIDRQEMLKELHNNEYKTVHSIFSPSYSLWYHSDIQKYCRNIDVAAEWLEGGDYAHPDYHHENLWILGLLPYLIGVPTLLLITYGIVKLITYSDKRAK